MMLRAEQRRALAMLATPGHNGATQLFLIVRGLAAPRSAGSSTAALWP
jgi:hypothetical protein